MDKKKIDEILDLYNKIKDKIEKRLKEFKLNYDSYDNNEVFVEFAFCLLTPQSKAKLCWDAIEKLKQNKLLFTGNSDTIINYLYGVRFKYKKSLYIVENRDKFSENGKIVIKQKILEFEKRCNSNRELRNLLVKEVKGYGFKEASHFLRNIGKGVNLAILDRHILKNMVYANIIDEIPKSLPKKKYLELEEKFIEFSKILNIDSQHLDFVLWYKEANDVFK